MAPALAAMPYAARVPPSEVRAHLAACSGRIAMCRSAAAEPESSALYWPPGSQKSQQAASPHAARLRQSQYRPHPAACPGPGKRPLAASPYAARLQRSQDRIHAAFRPSPGNLCWLRRRSAICFSASAEPQSSPLGCRPGSRNMPQRQLLRGFNGASIHPTLRFAQVLEICAGRVTAAPAAVWPHPSADPVHIREPKRASFSATRSPKGIEHLSLLRRAYTVLWIPAPPFERGIASEGGLSKRVGF